jgi:hypothetical protein
VRLVGTSRGGSWEKEKLTLAWMARRTSSASRPSLRGRRAPPRRRLLLLGGACSSSAALAPPRRRLLLLGGAWNLGLGARRGLRRERGAEGDGEGAERGAKGDGEGGRSEVQRAMGQKAAEQWSER